jgi:hypothetical protein
VNGEFIKEDQTNEKFKAMGFSVYMVNAKIGLAQLEVISRTKRLVDTWSAYRESGVSLADVTRDFASVADALDKLKKAEAR